MSHFTYYQHCDSGSTTIKMEIYNQEDDINIYIKNCWEGCDDNYNIILSGKLVHNDTYYYIYKLTHIKAMDKPTYEVLHKIMPRLENNSETLFPLEPVHLDLIFLDKPVKTENELGLGNINRSKDASFNPTFNLIVDLNNNIPNYPNAQDTISQETIPAFSYVSILKFIKMCST